MAALGTPEQVLQSGAVESLYSMERGSYNGLLGSVELPKPSGEPQVFVVAGGGWGIPVYRRLQKQGVPFATGILFENDVDFQVAQALSSRVISAPAFEEIPQSIFEQAAQLLKECTSVIDAGTPVGRLNEKNGSLLSMARQLGLPVTTMKESS